MADLTPVPPVVYIDEPLGDAPFIDTSCINPSEYTRTNYNLWDAPHERAYEWVEDRWVEASEAERIRRQIAEKKRLVAWSEWAQIGVIDPRPPVVAIRAEPAQL